MSPRVNSITLGYSRFKTTRNKAMTKLIKNVKDLSLVAAMNGAVPLPLPLVRHIKFGRQKFKEIDVGANASLLNHTVSEEFLLDEIRMCTGLTDINHEEVEVIYYPVSSRQETGLYAILLCLYNDNTMTVGYLYEGGYFVTDSIEYDRHEWSTVDKNWKYIRVSLLNITKLKRHATQNSFLYDEFNLTGNRILTTNSRENPTLSEELAFYGNTPGIDVIDGTITNSPTAESSLDDYPANETSQVTEDETVEHQGETTLSTVMELLDDRIKPIGQALLELTQLLGDNHNATLNLTQRVLFDVNQSSERVERSIRNLNRRHEVYPFFTGESDSLGPYGIRTGNTAPTGQSWSRKTYPPIENEMVFKLQQTVDALTQDNLKLNEEIRNIKETLAKIENVGSKDKSVIAKATQFIDTLLADESKDK